VNGRLEVGALPYQTLAPIQVTATKSCGRR